MRQMNYKIIFLFTYFMICLINNSCKSQKLISSSNENLLSDSKSEKIIYRFEDEISDSMDSYQRSDSNIILFYFFEGFNDTVQVKYNKTTLLIGSVFEDSNLVSTKFSGKFFGIKVDSLYSQLQIELISQKKTAMIALYRNYPICTLNRENGVWIANYRYKRLIIQ